MIKNLPDSSGNAHSGWELDAQFPDHPQVITGCPSTLPGTESLQDLFASAVTHITDVTGVSFSATEKANAYRQFFEAHQVAAEEWRKSRNGKDVLAIYPFKMLLVPVRHDLNQWLYRNLPATDPRRETLKAQGFQGPADSLIEHAEYETHFESSLDTQFVDSQLREKLKNALWEFAQAGVHITQEVANRVCFETSQKLCVLDQADFRDELSDPEEIQDLGLLNDPTKQTDFLIYTLFNALDDTDLQEVYRRYHGAKKQDNRRRQ